MLAEMLVRLYELTHLFFSNATGLLSCPYAENTCLLNWNDSLVLRKGAKF